MTEVTKNEHGMTVTRPEGNLAPDIELDENGNPVGKKIEYKRVVERLSYFAKDGNYGDAAGMTIIDTTDWVDDDFNMIDEASDGDRAEVARIISDWIESDRANETLKSQLESFGIEVPSTSEG